MLDSQVKHVGCLNLYPSGAMDLLGDRIRALRQARGLSQSQLAELCGVTKSAVSQWELGQSANIKLEVFLSLVDALGTSPHYLVFGPEKPRQGTSGATGRHRALHKT